MEKFNKVAKLKRKASFEAYTDYVTWRLVYSIYSIKKRIEKKG